MKKAEAKFHNIADDYILITTHDCSMDQEIRWVQMLLFLMRILKDEEIDWANNRTCYDQDFRKPFDNISEEEFDKVLDIPQHNPQRATSVNSSVKTFLKWIYPQE